MLVKIFKNIIYILMMAVIFGSGCSTPEYTVDFPEEISLGTSLVYINGEERNFENSSWYFKFMDGREVLSISFGESINGSEFIHQVAGSIFYPQENSDLTIIDYKTAEPDFVNVFFSQTYDEDLDGWEYKYCETNEDYFKLDTYDTTNHIISGSAQLRFKRVKKHGAPDGADLEKTLLIEIRFHDYYEVK